MFKKIAILLFVSMALLSACDTEVIEPILPPPPPLSDECFLFSYNLPLEYNDALRVDYEGDVLTDTVMFHFPHFTNLSSVIAEFAISEGASLLLDSVIQKSDTTANSMYLPLHYRVLAENGINQYSFYVIPKYPLTISTVSYSGEGFRVGGGDFSKPILYEVSNIVNGNWHYRVEALGKEYASVALARNNRFDIPNFLKEEEWLAINSGKDCEFEFKLSLSCDSLGISDSIFTVRFQREQFTVRSWQDLQYISTNLNGHYRIKKDIRFPLPGTQGFPTEGFYPLGDSIARPFKGSLDGNNHTIKDFYIRRSSDTTRYVGLFGFIERKMDNVPIIKNLGLEISDRIERGGVSGGWFTGGLAGWNEGKIINCYVRGTVVSKLPYGEPGACGGLVGFNNGGEISFCSAAGGYVEGTDQAGGLVGENSCGGAIFKSCSMQGVYLMGVGRYDDEYDIGAGGFVGRNSMNSIITNCYSTGIVEGTMGIGGFAGRHSAQGTIRCCYTASTVREIDDGASSSVGGFIGQLYGDEDRRSITDSYWNIAANPGLDGVGIGPITGVDGRSVIDFRSRTMFIGWDFDDVWGIDSGRNSGMAHLRHIENQQ